MDKYIGMRLEGRYDILELIGQGGMANVYRAHDIIDEKTVAVKILRDEYVNNADFLRRFKNESKAIAVLNHPNIVKVHDVSFSGINYIVMEYIDGVTLKEYIEHTGALLPKDAVHFTIQILHALQHAHDKGIVHRDIKPQNIMLLRNGEIKVTDFGIARFARSESRTISDRAIGSVHYISPEQAMGEYTDEKSDIYSTGIMFYEMLTGKLPFEADTAVSVAIKQIQSPIQKPTLINPSIPLGLEEITLRAVQKDSRSRYKSAAEMIVDLEAFRANPNVQFGYSDVSTKAYPEANQPRPRPKTTGSTPVSEGKISKRKKANKTKKPNPYLRIMLIVTIIVSLGSVAFVGIMIMMNSPYVSTDEEQLPDLVGQSFEDALVVYSEYELVNVGGEFQDEYNKGIIYEQSPKAYSKVKVGSKIKVYVSEGQKELTVGDYKDEAAARALSALRDLDLETSEERINDDNVAAGRVINTDPPAGSILKGGDTIKVFVSKGPEDKHISVPDVTGMPLDAAKELLENKDFVVGEITEEAHDLPEGTVISQYPAAGSMHYTSEPIKLTVSKGGMQRYSISVPLPTNMNREVTVRARIGEGDTPPIAESEIMNPAQSATGIWNPSFSGEKGETLRIRIYIDGRLYQEYILDFTDGTAERIQDFKESAHFQQ